MALTAQDVKIAPDLSATMGSIGTNAYNNIGANYAKAKGQIGQDASTLGRNGVAAIAPNSYAGQRMAATQGLDIGGLESALGGGVANTAYADTLHQRDFNQSEQLANEAAQLNQPSLFEQIMQGIGSVGKTGAAYYGASKGAGGGGGSSGSGNPSYGIADPSNFGLGYPSTPNFGYGQTYPNMLKNGGGY